MLTLTKVDKKHMSNYWLRRLGYKLIKYLDILIESEKVPMDIVHKTHRVNLLMKSVYKWYETDGKVSWKLQKGIELKI